jgi:hypothetical protein
MHANSIIFATTLQTKQYDEYIKNFNEIMQVPKDILGDNPRSYNFLMSQALKINTLNKYMPELYALHNKNTMDIAARLKVIYCIIIY